MTQLRPTCVFEEHTPAWHSHNQGTALYLEKFGKERDGNRTHVIHTTPSPGSTRDHSFEKSVPVSLLHQPEKRHEEFITSGQYGVRTHINGTQPREWILNVALAIIKNIPLELVKEWRRNTRHGRGHGMKQFHHQRGRLGQEDEKNAEEPHNMAGIQIWTSCMNNPYRILRIPHKPKAGDLEIIASSEFRIPPGLLSINHGKK